MPALPLDLARDFLRAHRIALVGLSRNPKDFTRGIARELIRRGYDVVPVNPAAGGAEIEGRTAFARLTEVTPPVDAALLFTAPGATEAVLRDCDEARVRKVWLHRGAGRGAATPAALAFCAAHGIAAVHDLCPWMALPGAHFPHGFHREMRRRFGRVAPDPRPGAAPRQEGR
jgi:predicted CoA-binding protein